MLSFLDKNLEKIICVFLISLISLVLGFQVFMRYVMHASLGWSEELARYCFVWLVFMGISFGAREMRHITIDAGLLCFPKFMRKYIVIVGEVLFLVFSVWIVYLGIGLVEKQIMIEQLSPAMRIPMWVVYSAPVVGFSLTAIRVVQAIIYTYKHRNDPEAVDEEQA